MNLSVVSQSVSLPLPPNSRTISGFATNAPIIHLPSKLSARHNHITIRSSASDHPLTFLRIAASSAVLFLGLTVGVSQAAASTSFLQPLPSKSQELAVTQGSKSIFAVKRNAIVFFFILIFLEANIIFLIIFFCLIINSLLMLRFCCLESECLV